MSTQIQTEHFTNALYTLLDETFDSVHGIFLDKGTYTLRIIWARFGKPCVA